MDKVSAPDAPPESFSFADDENTSSDEFRIYNMKITPCSKRYCHEWTTCPYAHPGEKARRRDPTLYNYTGIACPQMKQDGACIRGESCPYAHNTFEYWLHPTRYRTQLCNDGPACKRRVCFFAHRADELRVPPVKPYVPPEALAAATAAAITAEGRKAEASAASKLAMSQRADLMSIASRSLGSNANLQQHAASAMLTQQDAASARLDPHLAHLHLSIDTALQFSPHNQEMLLAMRQLLDGGSSSGDLAAAANGHTNNGSPPQGGMPAAASRGLPMYRSFSESSAQQQQPHSGPAAAATAADLISRLNLQRQQQQQQAPGRHPYQGEAGELAMLHQQQQMNMPDAAAAHTQQVLLAQLLAATDGAHNGQERQPGQHHPFAAAVFDGYQQQHQHPDALHDALHGSGVFASPGRPTSMGSQQQQQLAADFRMHSDSEWSEASVGPAMGRGPLYKSVSATSAYSRMSAEGQPPYQPGRASMDSYGDGNGYSLPSGSPGGGATVSQRLSVELAAGRLSLDASGRLVNGDFRNGSLPAAIPEYSDAADEPQAAWHGGRAGPPTEQAAPAGGAPANGLLPVNEQWE